MFSSRRANIIKTPHEAEMEKRMAEKAKPADPPKDQHRHSTKETVALAQEVMRSDLKWPLTRTESLWLIRTARSLAGSVLSQADPED